MPVRPANSPVSPAAELRLRNHADFQSVYRVARKQFAKEMSFFFAKRPELAHSQQSRPDQYKGPRIGLTVGKVLGKAHERNRIKRRLREAVRRQAWVLGSAPVDIVLHPRRTYLMLDWTAVELEVAQAFRTVSKLADKPQSPSPQRARRGGATKRSKQASKVGP